MEINGSLQARDLLPHIDRLWQLSAGKLRSLEETSPPEAGSPVFTAAGRYTARGWAEWTQGFQYGSYLLRFDATGDEFFLDLGRRRTTDVTPPHVTRIGVHDHGFNNVSTYGALWRLIQEGRLPRDGHEPALYELALRVSGAVQASRWRTTAHGDGYIYSFNGPQSLFVPNGESSMWGDYHARELALYLQREATGGPYYAFYGRSDTNARTAAGART